MIEIKNELFSKGYAIGGIRQPTVDKAILRVIARLGESSDDLRKLCLYISKFVIK